MPLSKARDKERKRQAKIRLELPVFQPKSAIPLYDPQKHKPGDTVRVIIAGRERVIQVPRLDADGNPIPE